MVAIFNFLDHTLSVSSGPQDVDTKTDLHVLRKFGKASGNSISQVT